MKRFKDFKKRSLALLLSLVMIICMFPATAFAEDGGSDAPAVTDEIPGSEDNETTGPAGEGDDDDSGEEGTDEDITEEIPAKDGANLIPEGTKPDVTTSVDGNTTITDTKWGWEYEKEDEEVKGEYKDDPDRTEGDGTTVDQILNGENLDNIEDGTYSKTDYYDKDDVKVTVNGSQDRTDWNEVDDQGRPVNDSFQVEGEQKTTETTTTTTKDVTTTVNKETDVAHTDEKLENGTEDPKVATEGGVHTSENKSDVATEKDDAKNGAETTATSTGKGNVTVTMNSGNSWTKTETDAESLKPVLPSLDKIYEKCEGWEVKGVDGSVVGTLNKDGNVVDETGKVLYKAEFTSNDGGKTYTFSLNAQSDVTTKTDTRKPTDKNGTIVDVDGDTVTPSEKHTTTGEVETKEGNWVLTTDEEGKLVYVKVDESTRTDENEWSEITGITEEDFLRVLNTFNHTITVSVPEAREVTGTTTITDNSHMNLVVVNGPNGEKVTVSGLSGNFKYLGADYIDGKGLQVNYKNSEGKYNVQGDPDTWTTSGTMIYKLQMLDADGNPAKDENGNDVIVYGYCVEKGVSLGKGSTYEFVNLNDAVNGKDTDYSKKDTTLGYDYKEGKYISDEERAHLNYIAEKGYWGDNLTAVQNLVDERYRSYITEETARSITQAALWRYADAAGREWGNKADQMFTQYNSGSGIKDQTEKAAYMALYNALINGKKSDTQTDLDDPNFKIEATDITQTTITVKNKVNSQAELNELVAAEQEKYEVEASVTMAIMPSHFGGVMLLVYVEGQDEPVASTRLTESSDTITRTGSDGNYTYTVKGLELAAGTKLNFKISGEQKLNDGVYLLQNSEFQNFATTIKSGSTRTIDINVEMSFTETQSKGQVVDTYNDRELQETWTVTTTETQDYTSETNYKDTKTTTVTITSSEESHEVVTNISEKVIEDVFWANSDSQSYTYIDESFTPEEGDDDDDDDDVEIPDEDIPLSELPDEEVELPDEDIPLAEMPDEEIELDDPDIPLADVPQTGDVSGMWYVMAVLSAAGLICMAAYERKKRQENRGCDA